MRILVVVGAVICGMLLLAGLLLPYTTDTIDSGPETASILSYGFQVFATPGGAGDSAIFGIAFFVLAAVAIANLVALVFVARGRVARTTPIMVSTVLLLLGTAGAWVVMLLGLSVDDWTLEAGLPVLTAGAVATAVLTLVSPIRRSWTA